MRSCFCWRVCGQASLLRALATKKLRGEDAGAAAAAAEAGDGWEDEVAGTDSIAEEAGGSPGTDDEGTPGG